jgi:hypothetical protein
VGSRVQSACPPPRRAPAFAPTALALALAAIGSLAACAEPRAATRPATAPDLPEPARPPERFDPAPVIEVRKVYLDGKHGGT